MRVAVVSEYYPRAASPVLGIWAHRQALAARDAGAEVRVLALHRLVPPRAALRERDARALIAPLRQPRRATIDGLEVTYVPFVAPPRWRSYAAWSRWAAPPLALALARLRRRWRYDLVHAHYAAPGGDAVRRARPRGPYVVSVHGGDLLAPWVATAAGRRAVGDGLRGAALVLANSSGSARRARALGAGETRIVHLGADLPTSAPPHRDGPPTIATVAHLVARKRHGDVMRALWLLRDRHPEVRYRVVGDGPQRGALEALAGRLGIAGRVEFTGELLHAAAVDEARAAAIFAMPSVDEALGVAYLEAMGAGVPAVGCIGEDGPEDIAAAGPGLLLVPPADVEALAGELEGLLADDRRRRELGRRARETVERSFTWERCGTATVAAYEAALRSPAPQAHAGRLPLRGAQAAGPPC